MSTSRDTAGLRVETRPGREHGRMHAAAVRFDLHLPGVRSLKEKRSVLRPVVEGLRVRFRVSVAEVGYHDQWQRAAVGVAVVTERAGRLDEVLATVERFVVAAAGVELLDTEVCYLEEPSVPGVEHARPAPTGTASRPGGEW